MFNVLWTMVMPATAAASVLAMLVLMSSVRGVPTAATIVAVVLMFTAAAACGAVFDELNIGQGVDDLPANAL